MLRLRVLLLTALVTASSASAQVVSSELINSQGAQAPCVGIGPIGGPLAKKCVDVFLQSGFLRTTDAGMSGLTVGNDGVVTKVDPGSPAAQAGIAAVDALTAIDGKPTTRTPGDLVQQAAFGKKGDTVALTVRRNGATVSVSFARAPQAAPPAPKVSGFMVSEKPLVNWQNQIVPCMGAGPAGIAALDFCDHRFEPYGYIKSSDLGGIGFQLDQKNTAKAIVSAVDANSPAAKAGLQVGDEVLTVNGKTPAPAPGETANEFLFGKIGDQKKVTLHNSHGDKIVTLTLAAPQKK